MKYVKMLGVASIAAAGLMGFAGVGSASAAHGTLTCPAGTLCPAGTSINAESEGKIVFDTPSGSVECHLALQGHTTTSAEGGAAGNADGPITGHILTNCGEATVEVPAHGTFTIESGGTFKSSNTTITMIHLGVHCIFETSNTTLGTVTNANAERNATLDLSGTIPRTGGLGGAFCGSSASLTGSLLFIAPAGFAVD